MKNTAPVHTIGLTETGTSERGKMGKEQPGAASIPREATFLQV